MTDRAGRIGRAAAFACVLASVVIAVFAATASARNVTISAVGDTMLGNTPKLPSNPAHYFDRVRHPLTSGVDAVFANHEGTLTTASGGKCGAGSSNCYAFRAPPRFAKAFKRAGFDVLNLANNHSYDFGAAGQRQTARAIRAAGIKHTGLPGEIAIVRAGRTRIAFLGFAPYAHMGNLLDIPGARRLVRRANRRAEVVIVYMHAGAEGAGKTHVPRGSEHAFGENRGNSRRFAKAMIDSGAAAVIASGPHVLRGIQFYKRRPIAYSLGNFAGFHNFSTSGASAHSAILRLTLRPSGRFVSGRVVPVRASGAGRPIRGGRAIAMIRALSRADFGESSPAILADGRFRPRS